MLLSVMIMPILLATEAVVLVTNYPLVPINICIELSILFGLYVFHELMSLVSCVFIYQHFSVSD